MSPLQTTKTSCPFSGLNRACEGGETEASIFGRLFCKCFRNSDWNQCKLLSSLEANIEQLGQSTQDSLLHRAVVRGHTEAVRELLELKANVGSQNREGSTPLSSAVIHKSHLSIVEMLVVPR